MFKRIHLKSKLKQISLLTNQQTRKISQRANDLPLKSVWNTFTPLANENNAINLGQGFVFLRKIMK